MTTFAANPASEREAARHELAVAAARHQARNRPLHLLLLSCILLGVAFVVLLLSVGARSTAKAKLSGERRRSEDVQRLAGELTSLDAIVKSGTRNRYEQIGDMLTRFTNAANSAGLRNLPTPQERPRTATGKRTYVYEIRDDSVPTILQWIQTAMKDIPGLEIAGIELTPEPNQWKAKVTFVRWERNP